MPALVEMLFDDAKILYREILLEIIEEDADGSPTKLDVVPDQRIRMGHKYITALVPEVNFKSL